MTKRKLQRFAETATFPNFFQPSLEEVAEAYHLRRQWSREHFRNDFPICLELGCGKGEFTLGLAQGDPRGNYIGVDIKGARMWRGAKTALEQHMANVAFIRSQVFYLDRIFAPGEISAIWITFPDPQPQKTRENKRLTGPRFLDIYRRILCTNGVVNLKTDDDGFFAFTLETLEAQKIQADFLTWDIYSEAPNETAAGIKTFYEEMWLAQGKKIKYVRFRLNPASDGQNP